jgi:hypothetical protein
MVSMISGGISKLSKGSFVQSSGQICMGGIPRDISTLKDRLGNLLNTYSVEKI